MGVGYTGKEARYSTGKSKRLKEKFTFIGTGKDFMEKLSLITEERLSLSKVKKGHLRRRRGFLDNLRDQRLLFFCHLSTLFLSSL